MPRYFFDIDDGGTPLRDVEGIVFLDDTAASNEACRALADLAADFIQSGAPQARLTMRVRGEDGIARLQLSLNFTIRTLI
jgi:hypothetical protein